MKISVVNWLKILCLTNFLDCFDIINSTSTIFSNQFTFRQALCNANNNIYFITNEQYLDSCISEIARSLCTWIKEHYCPQWPPLHKRPPLYNNHFFWRTVHTFALVSTSLQWLLSSVPKVAIVERFNCDTLIKQGQSLDTLDCRVTGRNFNPYSLKVLPRVLNRIRHRRLPNYKYAAVTNGGAVK